MLNSSPPIDDLPVRGFIGQLEEHVLSAMHKVYLWTHMHFHLEYNGNQVRRGGARTRPRRLRPQCARNATSDSAPLHAAAAASASPRLSAST